MTVRSKRRNQVPHSQMSPPHIDQWINHQLAGAVIGHLATAIDPHHRDPTRIEHVPGIGIEPQCVNRFVLE